MSSRKTDAEIEQLWQAHAWGGKHHEELREDHRRARASETALLDAVRDLAHEPGLWSDCNDRRCGECYACRIRVSVAQAEGSEP